MATRLNTQMPASTTRPQPEAAGLFKRIGRAIRDVMVTPQSVTKEQVTRRDNFQMGTPTFQAAAKRLMNNASGNGFEARKIDPNARSARDQALVGWLSSEFLSDQPTPPAQRNPQRRVA